MIFGLTEVMVDKKILNFLVIQKCKLTTVKKFTYKGMEKIKLLINLLGCNLTLSLTNTVNILYYYQH